MHILITGGTGFIGSTLVRQFLNQGHQLTLYVRDYAAARLKLGPDPVLVRHLDEIPNTARIDAIINLAGENIASERWTQQRKQTLINSRILPTRELVQLVARLEVRPDVWINSSAIGYYGSQLPGAESPLAEADSGQPEFTHELCRRWEAEARKAEVHGVRVCLVRTGIVLGNGGMLAQLLPMYRLWLGGRIGSGKQMMSWIQLQDLLAIFQHLLNSPSSRGVYNAVAPEPVTQATFSATLASLLRRPALLNLRASWVRTLFGEMGDRLLLQGQLVKPARLQDESFVYNYPDVRSALQASLCDFGLN